MQLFSIFDKKAQIYGPIFAAENGGVAFRMTQLMQSRETLLAQHPADFALYSLGSWDPDAGKIEPNTAPLFVSQLEDLEPTTQLEAVQ